MLKLWKNCDVYAPAHLGKRDILVMGTQIWKIEADLSAWESVPEIEVLDLGGAIVCPGLVDLHVDVYKRQRWNCVSSGFQRSGHV